MLTFYFRWFLYEFLSFWGEDNIMCRFIIKSEGLINFVIYNQKQSLCKNIYIKNMKISNSIAISTFTHGKFSWRNFNFILGWARSTQFFKLARIYKFIFLFLVFVCKRGCSLKKEKTPKLSVCEHRLSV